MGTMSGEGERNLLVSIWAEAEETMLPSWYATPGKVARKAGGEISASWMGIWRARDASVRVPRCGTGMERLTTPHAPWTPNWMQNAPAARALKEVGRIQRGMNAVR